MKGYFLTGLHYWPARKGVFWWSNFDAAEVDADFKRIRQMGFKVVRIQLLWEDFQPTRHEVREETVAALKVVLDLAARYRLKVQPSFFSGHLSGVNFLPPWMLSDSRTTPSPYPVYSGGQLVEGACVRNCFADAELWAAQKRLVSHIVGLFKSHPGLYGWDIGGGMSRFYPPEAPLERAPEEGHTPVSTLTWLGRAGRTDESLGNRLDTMQALRVSLLDEEDEEDDSAWRSTSREESSEDFDAEISRAEPVSPKTFHPPFIRRVRAERTPGGRQILGMGAGIIVYDTETVSEQRVPLRERGYLEARPSEEQISKLSKAGTSAAALAQVDDSLRPAASTVECGEAVAAVEQPITAAYQETVPVVQPTRRDATQWVEMMVGVIRSIDGKHPVSISLLADDVDSSTAFSVADLTPLVDFVGITAHPGLTRWARSPLDAMALPFLGLLGDALSGKKIVLLEVGLPAVKEEVYHAGRQLSYSISHEQEAADLLSDILEGLLRVGALGALCWNFADYHPSLWNRPPLLYTPEERWSGLLRLDGSWKPAAYMIRDFAAWDHPLLDPPFHLQVHNSVYETDPPGRIIEVFDQFLQAVGDK